MHRAPFIICLGIITSLATAAAPPNDWPQFRGPAGQGVAPDTNLPTTWSATENVLWKTDLPGPGTSSPILSGPRIFLTTYTGASEGDVANLKRQLICLDRATGKINWSQEIAAKQPEQPKVRDGHGWATNTPAADDQRVYAFFGKSGVYAYDLAGKQIWQADVGDKINPWGSSASPILHTKLVIINASVESGTMYGLDRATGKEIWRIPNIKESWNTPIIATNPAGKPELIVAVMQKILAFNPDTGAPLWSCNTDINWYMVPGLVAKDGVVYCIGGRTGGALAVKLGGTGDVTATHRIWTGKKGSNVSSPILHENNLYWVNDAQGIAYCANAKTGDILYEQPLGRGAQTYASPVLADGKIFYTTRMGQTHVLPAKPEFKILATNQLEQRSITDATPAIADNKIYFRTNKFLYCLAAK